MKKLGILASFFAAIILLGAGCGDDQGTNQTTNGQGNNTTTPTTTDNNTTTDSNGSGFGITVSPLGNGRVQVSWTVPENFDRTQSIRVLHSGRPDSDRPFYFQYMNSVRNTELGNVPTGTRYFKVCEYKNNQYGNCSEQIQVNVN